MSGQTGEHSPSLPNDDGIDWQQVVAAVRGASGVTADVGPDDDHIRAAIQGFVEAFDFRYIQVIRKSVPKYRSVIVERINPLIRRFQLEELNAEDVARRVIDDWAARNFVTAGGFAIEALAIGISPNAQKSATEGIDLQRFDAGTKAYHLYVLKSGSVTRNSDILKSLKANTRKAEKILRGDKSVTGITANYAIASGKTSPTTFEDGVNRPSTQELWAELTGVEPALAVQLVLAVAAVAGRLVRRDAVEPLEALRILVASYIADLDDPRRVDWRWVERRTMQEKSSWKEEDQVRNTLAVEALADAGFDLAGTRLSPGEAAPEPSETEEAEAEPLTGEELMPPEATEDG